MTPTTDTTNPSTDDPRVASDTAALAVRMNPADLVIDANVRQNFDLDAHPEVRDSIRELGVKTPITAFREADGRIVVTNGQIRTLIALELGLDLVPVWIEPAPDAPTKQRRIARITEQINVNDRCIPLTIGDRAAGIAEMLDLGMSVTRVSKAVQERDLDKIRLYGKAGQSATACRLLDGEQLDLGMAAVIAEYDNAGDAEAIERLLATPRSSFKYQAARIANERSHARELFATALTYASHGFALLTTEPYDSDPCEFIPAEGLRTAAGHEIDSEALHQDPTRWAVYLERNDLPHMVDRKTGEHVDHKKIDWSTRHHPDAAPAEGLHHADSVEQGYEWTPYFYLPVHEFDAGGYQIPTEPTEIDTETEPSETTGATPPVPAIDPEEARRAAEQAKATREQAEREAKQVEHRRRGLRKQSDAATDARCEFVQTYLTRNTAPPSAARFILEAISASKPILLDDYQGIRTALKLLGIEGWRNELEAAALNCKPARCMVILLGLVFGYYESRIGADSWGHRDSGTARYLHYLAELGHHLMPVEQAAAGDLDPTTVPIDN
ncbi:hypothetical protein D5S18_08210 [Nocardia panacis]|uniref:ParB-like N-terminal domain-containing protein n=1 Tax=Nocardia panacis TaxID=2340916 RepID=A0A3A4KW56_9NOCA|nr:ParB/Srx family N-terminal domain-containing protein [Nocardia panacis]RJO77704.1 hypothetical protein D5S18_08210 [Nocardia panacis]